MKPATFIIALFALVLITYVAANDPTQNEIKPPGENQEVYEKQQFGGGWGPGWGGWGGWGGRGGGWGPGWGGWGGRGGWGGWGGRRGWGGGYCRGGC